MQTIQFVEENLREITTASIGVIKERKEKSLGKIYFGFNWKEFFLVDLLNRQITAKNFLLTSDMWGDQENELSIIMPKLVQNCRLHHTTLSALRLVGMDIGY